MIPRGKNDFSQVGYKTRTQKYTKPEGMNVFKRTQLMTQHQS